MAHDQEVVGFNPITEYWMDVRDIAYINEIKVAKLRTPFF
jgi:hypothetical protein